MLIISLRAFIIPNKLSENGNINESVNFSCAQTPPSLRASPQEFFFFPYGWQISGGGGTYAVKHPAVGTKVESKCPAPQTALNLWPDIRVLDLKFSKPLPKLYLSPWVPAGSPGVSLESTHGEANDTCIS